jgi:hypothetical protein
MPEDTVDVLGTNISAIKHINIKIVFVGLRKPSTQISISLAGHLYPRVGVLFATLVSEYKLPVG